MQVCYKRCYKINLKKDFLIKLMILIIIIWLINLMHLKAISIINESNEFKAAKIFFQNFYNKNFERLEFKDKIQRRKYNFMNYSINCKLIFEMDKKEIKNSKFFLEALRNKNGLIDLLPDDNFIFEKNNCGLFKKVRRYNRYIIDKLEYDFPLAFIIMVHNNVEQFERFLNAVYRPHNIYCIHVDSKSSRQLYNAIKSIVSCFDNVFIASKLERIVYGGFTRLKADINCMTDLLNLDKLLNVTKVQWKYLLNSASTEYPLRTNYELTRILNMYNGSNDIEIIKNVPFNRIHFRWFLGSNGKLKKTNYLKSSPPQTFTIAKGYAYCAFNRRLIEFAINDKRANELLNWSMDTYSPDEWFWATLQFNNKITQSGFKDIVGNRIETMARFAGWSGEYNCKGMRRNGVCVFSIEDLPELIKRKHFFVNKFLLEYDPITYECMETWLNNRMKNQPIFNLFDYCKFISQHSSLVNCPKLI